MSSKSELQDDKRPLASIPLETFLYFDQLFSVIQNNLNFFQGIYFILELLVFVYKGYGLFYPPNTIGIEVFLLFAFAFIQFSRIFIGSVGNKTEAPSQIIWFLILSVPTAFLYAFFLRLQTYVIVLEVIINVIGLSFLVFEFLFSISAFLTFKNYEKNQ